jgi:formiminoglutamase
MVELINLLKPILPPKDQTPGIAVLGFCCDAGIRRNHGRPGAVEGPSAIRRKLGNLTLPVNAFQLIDAGDVVCDNDDLEMAQEALAQAVSLLVENKWIPIVLGGGHETAWGHFSGLNKHYSELSIVNVDAHFDLRPYLEGGLGSSGTPFFQIGQSLREQGKSFSYSVLGIQPLVNTKSLFQRADEWGVRYLYRDQVVELPPEEALRLIGLDQKPQQIYLTVCLDAFAQSVAPGVSAPQPLGLMPDTVIRLMKLILSRHQVVAMDIVELSPPLDRDEQTARLAAYLAANFITMKIAQ